MQNVHSLTFSVGRLEVNHLQHNTRPQTFKAQVAVGSWARTPLYPKLSEMLKIVERHIQGESRAGVGERYIETDEGSSAMNKPGFSQDK